MLATERKVSASTHANVDAPLRRFAFTAIRSGAFLGAPLATQRFGSITSLRLMSFASYRPRRRACTSQAGPSHDHGFALVSAVRALLRRDRRRLAYLRADGGELVDGRDSQDHIARASAPFLGGCGTQIRKILEHIGAPSQAPRISPARGPPLWEGCDAQMGEGVEIEPDWDLAAYLLKRDADTRAAQCSHTRPAWSGHDLLQSKRSLDC